MVENRQNTLGIVAFDLDGTLLRGKTVCEVLAKPLGRSIEMERLEADRSEKALRVAREEMASWYNGYSVPQLQGFLADASWAPGAQAAVSLLQRAGIRVAIASYTWSFAVEWFAGRLGVRDFLGTGLGVSGEIDHVWAQDKADWFKGIVEGLDVPFERTAGIGDSDGDAELLRTVHLRFSVGRDPIRGVPRVTHLPGADIRQIAERLLDAWDLD